MFCLRRISGRCEPLASLNIISVRAKGYAARDRQATAMTKLFSGKSKSKGFWFRERDPKPLLPKSLSHTHRETKGASRRVVVLNKMFMKHVTGIMATGEISEVVLGHGIEITRVNVSIDFQLLSVYWMSVDPKANTEALEDILKRTAGPLRHELSQLKLMGEVPHIVFVKDKQYSELCEVDRRLAIADYGDDHQPNSPGTNEHREFSPQFRTTALDDSDEPPMRHDVFSLDHAQIMERIRISMSKTRLAWDRHDGLIQKNELSPNEVGYVTADMADRAHDQSKLNSELLQDFLKRRKLEGKMKMSKEKKDAELRSDDYEYDGQQGYDDQNDFADDDDDKDYYCDWEEYKE